MAADCNITHSLYFSDSCGSAKRELRSMEKTTTCLPEKTPGLCPFGCGVKGRDHEEKAVYKHCVILLQIIVSLRQRYDQQREKEVDLMSEVPQRLQDVEKKLCQLQDKVNEMSSPKQTSSTSSPSKMTSPSTDLEQTSMEDLTERRMVELESLVSSLLTSINEHPPNPDLVTAVTNQDPHTSLNSFYQRLIVLETRVTALLDVIKTVKNQHRRLENGINMNAYVGRQLELRIANLESSLASKNRKLAEGEKRLRQLETISYNGVLVWKISNASGLLQDGGPTTATSRPFYTKMFEYKMCCSLNITRDAMGAATHISIFFVIMKGQYDAILPWPFKQKVTLMLLDQNSGSGLKVVINSSLCSSGSSFHRPEGEMKVITHNPLVCPVSLILEDKTSDFVKDDVIFVKVIVEWVQIQIQILLLRIKDCYSIDTIKCIIPLYVNWSGFPQISHHCKSIEIFNS